MKTISYLITLFTILLSSAIVDSSAYATPPYSVNDYINTYGHPYLYVNNGNIMLDLSSVRLTEQLIKSLSLNQEDKAQLVKLYKGESSIEPSRLSPYNLAQIVCEYRLTKENRKELRKHKKMRSIKKIRLTTLEGLERIKNYNRITTINLNGNALSKIKTRDFSKFTNLHALSFANNRIRSIPDHFFRDFLHMEKINLHGNRIKKVKATSLTHLSQLIYLNLSNNRINEIERYSFLFLSNLRTLNLHSNRLDSLPHNAFYGPSNLIHVCLLDNPIVNVPSTKS